MYKRSVSYPLLLGTRLQTLAMLYMALAIPICDFVLFPDFPINAPHERLGAYAPQQGPEHLRCRANQGARSTGYP